MTTPREFAVQPIDAVPVADLLEGLSAAYGETFSEDWFTWKHRDGPWGPSRGWVAVDDAGVGGLMFSLPWQYRVADTVCSAARLVDGGTVPRALRRGLFRVLVGRELSEWGPAGDAGIVVATATPEARQSHLKLGATGLEPVAFFYGPAPIWRRARLTTGTEVLDRFVLDDRVHLTTPWDGTSLRWRTDHRAGYAYEAACLAEADVPNGVVYRIFSARGIRIMLPLVVWGSARDQKVLLGAVARQHTACGVLGPAGGGASRVAWRPMLQRGKSLLCVWDRTVAGGARPNPLERASWALTEADLEGVI